MILKIGGDVTISQKSSLGTLAREKGTSESALAWNEGSSGGVGG
jgi:hypothetical protein